jgi:hypothetical protein
MSEVTVELGEPEVTIDYSTLAASLMEEAQSSIEDIVNECIEHYMRYELDLSDMVSDYVQSEIGEQIDSLLNDVSPNNLCSLGLSFESAVRTLLVHHIDMKEVLIQNIGIESSGGIAQLVQDSLKKEMVVNISFVDKEPAEVVEQATNLLPGPVDEINTRSDNV